MKIASITFKVLFLISCVFGLALTVQSAPSFAIFISYYTTQSNVLVLIVMIVVLFWEIVGQGRKSRFLCVLKSLATVSILVTFLIYHFILSPNIDSSMTNVSEGFGNILVHYITPLWFFLDYLFFEVKGSTRLLDPFFYVLFPVYYFVYSNFRALNGELYQYGSSISQFPYPFLDYAVFGIYGVSAAVLVIAIADMIIGFLFIGLDKLMKKPRARYQSQAFGTISIKPIAHHRYRLFKSKKPQVESVIETIFDKLPDDSIDNLDFPDADRFE